ncbi:MAG: hypothetical protein RRE78_09250 [Acidianus sp.]|nr:hypothetical protein [Acidianus sp.]
MKIKLWKAEIILEVSSEDLKPCEGKIIPSYRKMKNVKFYVHQDEKGNVKIKKIG